jgi:putative mycofactocin binding protein MftB
MASAASTNRTMSEGERTTEYALREGVRARREAFGLLFYNSADTRLTFVKSGNLLEVERMPEGAFSLRSSCNGDHDDMEGKTRRVIETLLKKGLIVETRATI